VFSGCVQCAHGSAELGSASTGSRVYRESDPATHPPVPHNRYIQIAITYNNNVI